MVKASLKVIGESVIICSMTSVLLIDKISKSNAATHYYKNSKYIGTTSPSLCLRASIDIEQIFPLGDIRTTTCRFMCFTAYANYHSRHQAKHLLLWDIFVMFDMCNLNTTDLGGFHRIPET